MDLAKSQRSIRSQIDKVVMTKCVSLIVTHSCLYQWCFMYVMVILMALF